jgi:hypothetical protein
MGPVPIWGLEWNRKHGKAKGIEALGKTVPLHIKQHQPTGAGRNFAGLSFSKGANLS